MAAAVLEAADGFAPLRNALRGLAEDLDTYSGIPMPLEHTKLVIEPSYPNAKQLMAMGAAEEDAEPPVKIRNRWYSLQRGSEVVVWEDNGKITFGLLPQIHHLTQDLETIDCADAWGVEQEHNSLVLLAGLLDHRRFKQYLLTGMFIEQSKRSNVYYLFRRLKPTVAMRVRPGEGYNVTILCALCLHPIGYYAGTWAGAMAPTDDVIAHLMLMRGDEHMFWRRSNQIPAWSKMAGL